MDEFIKELMDLGAQKDRAVSDEERRLIIKEAEDLYNKYLPGVNHKNECYYPILIRDNDYDKLLAIQTKPELKYWFKDVEITMDKLIEILNRSI